MSDRAAARASAWREFSAWFIAMLEEDHGERQAPMRELLGWLIEQDVARMLWPGSSHHAICLTPWGSMEEVSPQPLVAARYDAHRAQFFIEVQAGDDDALWETTLYDEDRVRDALSLAIHQMIETHGVR